MAGLNKQVWQVVFLETLVSLLISIAIGLISYRFLEAPFLKLKDKFYYGKKDIVQIKNQVVDNQL